jgi:hypothetical protein
MEEMSYQKQGLEQELSDLKGKNKRDSPKLLSLKSKLIEEENLRKSLDD